MGDYYPEKGCSKMVGLAASGSSFLYEGRGRDDTGRLSPRIQGAFLGAIPQDLGFMSDRNRWESENMEAEFIK